MRARKKPAVEDDSVKMKILLASEILFATHGVFGASLREIAVRAGQGNHYAVQYHFRDREGLIQALYDFRMMQMEQIRGRMLREAKAKSLLRDARTIIEIILLPQLQLQDADGNHSYASFLSQLLLLNQSPRFGDFGSQLPPNLTRALTLLRRRLSYLSEPVAQRRLVGACLLFLNMLAGRGANEGSIHGEPLDAALDDTLEQIVVGLCMAPRRMPDRGCTLLGPHNVEPIVRK